MSKDDLRKQVQDDGDSFTDPNSPFRVEGNVFVGSIGKSGKGKKRADGKPATVSNVVNCIGYKIVNTETDEFYFMEKYEAIAFVKDHKAQNASIRVRRQAVKDENGNVIRENYSMNLHPVRGDRPFTHADRLYPVYKLDENGNLEKPLQLIFEREHATDALWEKIMEDYKRRKPRNRVSTYNKKLSDKEKLERIEKALQAVNFQGGHNPFEK